MVATCRGSWPALEFRLRISYTAGWGPHATKKGIRMDETITEPRIKDETKPARPKLHKVILLNDDYTPRGFVVRVLKAEFGMGEGRAYGVMMTAHRLGSCVVAVFTKEVAEEKATRATDMAREEGHPLTFTTEPEE